MLYNVEFWDKDGKRHTGIYIPIDPKYVLQGQKYGSNKSVVGLLVIPNVPSVSNVRTGVSFGSNNTLTGILQLPATNEVLSGIGYGANGTEFVGTVTIGSNAPGTSTNDATIGYVLTNREFWLQDGTRLVGIYYPVLSPADVRAGVSFGSNQSLQGTLTNRSSITQGNLTISLPNGIYEGKQTVATDSDLVAGNVRTGKNIFGTDGSLTLPEVTNVQKGVQYGANGTEYTGTLKVPFLPQRTGQVQTLRAGDDGNYKKGYTGGYTNSGGDWDGNTRFKVTNISGGDVVIDNLTGLMWTFDRFDVDI